MSCRVLLVEPWFGGSHAAWADGWRTSSRHDVHLLAHEAVGWRWRMRGAAVTLAAETTAWVEVHGPPDVIVATDMLDLAAHLGLTRRTLGGVPAVLYLHENQLTYPRQPGEPLDQGLAWATWRSLVAADEIWCNSAFHRDDLLAALPGFLAAVPDHDHRELLAAVETKTHVRQVGVDLSPVETPESRRPHPDGPLVLSNQRWHHDKDLGSVLRALRRLADRGLRFRLAMVGDDTGGERDALQPLIDDLGPRVEVAGHLPRADYLALLGRADIVVSAARNEFFGIAVVEALAAGAVPVVPDGLAYREVIPVEFHETALYPAGGLTGALETAITHLDRCRASLRGLDESVRRFDWSVTAPGYDDAVDRLASARPA